MKSVTAPRRMRSAMLPRAPPATAPSASAGARRRVRQTATRTAAATAPVSHQQPASGFAVRRQEAEGDAAIEAQVEVQEGRDLDRRGQGAGPCLGKLIDPGHTDREDHGGQSDRSSAKLPNGGGGGCAVPIRHAQSPGW